MPGSAPPQRRKRSGRSGPSNRLIGFPYRKYMNSNNNVDRPRRSSCARSSGRRASACPRDRWIFPHSGTDCHEHPYVSHRRHVRRTTPIERAARGTLELAGAGIDDVGEVDLYSCFPSAVQLGAASLGLVDWIDSSRAPAAWRSPAARGTTTPMHAIATVGRRAARAIRARSGFVWANGGYATKHAFGVYGTGRRRTASARRAADEIDALPRRAAWPPRGGRGRDRSRPTP